MTRHNIINGPSKLSLMFSLFDDDLKHRKTVEFLTEEDGGLSTLISKLERECGSGETWLFKGYCQTMKKKISGYYSTRTRRGWLEYD